MVGHSALPFETVHCRSRPLPVEFICTIPRWLKAVKHDDEKVYPEFLAVLEAGNAHQRGERIRRVSGADQCDDDGSRGYGGNWAGRGSDGPDSHAVWRGAVQMPVGQNSAGYDFR